MILDIEHAASASIERCSRQTEDLLRNIRQSPEGFAVARIAVGTLMDFIPDKQINTIWIDFFEVLIQSVPGILSQEFVSFLRL